MDSGYWIDMIDVGEGDAFAVCSAVSRHVCLIDAGPHGGADKLVKHINSVYGGHINDLVLTHVDNDHIEGVHDLLGAGIRFDRVLVNDPRDYQQGINKEAAMLITASVKESSNVIDALAGKGTPREEAFTGAQIALSDDLTLRVLSPDPRSYAAAVPRFSQRNQRQLLEKLAAREKKRSCSAENEVCVVLELEYSPPGESTERALFTADACLPVLWEVSGVAYDWVKIPHHGSWHNCEEELVETWCAGQETTAALSYGHGNRYRHPDSAVTQWFSTHARRVRCTVCNGTVSFRRGGAPSHPGFSSLKSACTC